MRLREGKPRVTSQQMQSQGFKVSLSHTRLLTTEIQPVPPGHPEEKGWEGSPHLAIHHLGLLGPVPHGKHVVVGFIHRTEQVAPILGERGKVGQDPSPPKLPAMGHLPLSPVLRFSKALAHVT